ncbi:MAG TPA: PDZ domain-containing protein [Chthoniobacterales bacterium]|nr:PDZ domain-containing protein [Chthoniobacterales bacterium]
MKTPTITVLAAAALLPLSGLAQMPPAPPAPAAPAAPAAPPAPPTGDKGPKVPVTFLGVETSDVPRVVAEQLGLPKGFGLVVDYVVPDGPAAAAGVQQNDILRMFNDQILVEPDQLSKLVRSQAEGTNVTLTVMRKGAETKLTVRLGKREVSQRHNRWERHWKHGDNAFLGEDFREQMREMQREISRANKDAVSEAVRAAREQARLAREEARRARDEARRQARNVRVTTSNENGAIKTTRIDLGKAEIAYSDDKGEMRIQNVDGKKTLIAKDPQGRLLFSGPVTTKEELDKVPAEVRQRYEKLEQKDLPAIPQPPQPPNVTSTTEEPDFDVDFESDFDLNVDDDDDDNDNSEAGDVQSISAPFKTAPTFPVRRVGFHSVLI